MLLIVTGVIFLAAAVFALWENLREMPAKQKMLVIIPLTKGMNDLEIRLREAASTANGGSLLLLDLGTEEEALEICRRFARKADIFKIIPRENIDDPLILRETILSELSCL